MDFVKTASTVNKDEKPSTTPDEIWQRTRTNRILKFDISAKSLDPLKLNQVIKTVKGKALGNFFATYNFKILIVRGLYDGYIWFYIEGDSGVSFWDDVRSVADIRQKNFEILSDVETPIRFNTIIKLNFSIQPILCGSGSRRSF